MTEKDDFLSRWSRRKQAAAREAKLPHKEEEGAAKAVDATGDAAAQKLNAFAPDAAKSESVFDLSKLPSLEFDRTRQRHPAIHAAGRAGVVIACGASSRMVGRSGDPGLYRAFGECMGLHKTRKHPGVWSAIADRRRETIAISNIEGC